MSRGEFHLIDLFAGAGGESTGAVQALEARGFCPRITAINHWPTAVETHAANHPTARHLCMSVDQVNPLDLYEEGQLDALWVSPECTHHSVARGGRPINDQSRATAWCVVRWAAALRPPVIWVENVPEFCSWAPIGSNGRPLASRKGEVFRAWIGALKSLGYRVDSRILCAADYGDPTTRRRLFVQAVLGRRKIVWPETTHSEVVESDLFGSKLRWRGAREVIDWSLPSQSIFTRKRPLSARTLGRINAGLEAYGLNPFLIHLAHAGNGRRPLSVDEPLPTVAGNRGDVAFSLPQQSGGKLRPVSEPFPTVATAGAMALVVEYYSNGVLRPVCEPLPTVTCKHRFGLLQAGLRDIHFRMLQPHELAAAQGFPVDYRFSGTKTEKIKQIGNAVPCGLARALLDAHITSLAA